MNLLAVDLAVLTGAFVQEVISPLPSFLLFVPAGASLQAGGAGPWHLAGLIALIGLVRVAASWLLYWLSSRVRTWLFTRERSWLGIRAADIDRLGARLGSRGSGWAVFGLWALPFVPGTLIALAAGFVKVPRPAFATGTYFGSMINASVYLLIGYYGWQLGVQ